MDIRSISSAAALRVALTVLGVIVALRFLWLAHAVFVIGFLGILLGLGLSRAVDLLEHVRVPRAAGAPLAMLLVLAVVAAIVSFGATSIRSQVRELSRELPRLLGSAGNRIERSPARVLVGAPGAEGGPAPQAPPDAQPPARPAREGSGASRPPAEGGEAPQPGSQLQAQMQREMQRLTRMLFPLVSSAVGALAGIVMVLFIAVYIAAEPRLYRSGLLHLVPKRNRPRAAEVIDTLRDTLRQWLIARLMAMVAVGAVTGLALTALQVRGALALGVLSGLLEFVPFFGPIASSIPAIGSALLDSPQKGLSVALLFVVVQQLEGSLLTPLLLERRLDIPPVLTLIFVAALGVVFGILGMLIAEPILAAVLVAIRMLYVEDVVGDEVGTRPAEG